MQLFLGLVGFIVFKIFFLTETSHPQLQTHLNMTMPEVLSPAFRQWGVWGLPY